VTAAQRVVINEPAGDLALALMRQCVARGQGVLLLNLIAGGPSLLHLAVATRGLRVSRQAAVNLSLEHVSAALSVADRAMLELVIIVSPQDQDASASGPGTALNVQLGRQGRQAGQLVDELLALTDLAAQVDRLLWVKVSGEGLAGAPV
jgi:hypothetical protein